MRMAIHLALAGGLLAAGAAQAEVKSANLAGFEIAQKLTIKAPPTEVYDALADIGRWWNPQHSYSGDAARLRLDARAGGCFCETLADGGSVQHGVVVFAQRPQLLRVSGALGPLQAMGVAATATWTLVPAGRGSELQFGYVVGGYGSPSLETLAPLVDGVLAEQMQRLKAYVETGKPQ